MRTLPFVPLISLAANPFFAIRQVNTITITEPLPIVQVLAKTAFCRPVWGWFVILVTAGNGLDPTHLPVLTGGLMTPRAKGLHSAISMGYITMPKPISITGLIPAFNSLPDRISTRWHPMPLPLPGGFRQIPIGRAHV